MNNVLKYLGGALEMKFLVIVSFVIMVIVNALANILPINNITTGEVSDAYQNLFAPAGLTFAIWGLIYLLLFGFTIYQTGLMSREKSIFFESRLNIIRSLFSISSILNALWIFAWHYDLIGTSLILMIGILICLIWISLVLRKKDLQWVFDKVFIKLPFSVYFGWITVATIANVTTLLVKMQWDKFGLTEPTWMVIIVCVGLIIGVSTMLANKDIVYGLVIIWAYIGILIKHISTTGFNEQYPNVIVAVMMSISIIVIFIAFIIQVKKQELKTKSFV